MAFWLCEVGNSDSTLAGADEVFLYGLLLEALAGTLFWALFVLLLLRAANPLAVWQQSVFSALVDV